MRPNTIDRIRKLAEQNQGFLKTSDFLDNHISKTHLSTMVNEGWLERVKRGLYRLAEIDPVSYDSFIDAQKAIPQCIICFHSAMEYYGLSTINPQRVQVAVPRKANVTPPDYPPSEVYYLTEWYYHIGITEVPIRNEKVRIYTPEKTLCDCIRYRNKIGADLAIETFKNYIRAYNRKDLNLLLHTAVQCKVEEKVRNYMEVLV